MTTAAAKMDSALVTTALRASTDIAAEIGRLEQDLARGMARMDTLQTAYDAAILKGDKEAEANETETAAVRRGIRRAELRLVDLRSQFTDAEQREREAAALALRDQATKAVDDILARLDQGYLAPALEIVAFLNDWREATTLADRAGVMGPDERGRAKPEQREPEREEVRKVYIDESGRETNEAFPPGAYRVDAQGRKLDRTNHQPLAERPSRMKTVIIPRKLVSAFTLTPLVQAVSLPAPRIGDDKIW